MSITFDNAALPVGGLHGCHWVEVDEAKRLRGEFRDANDYLQDHGYSSLKHTSGYYCDSFQDTTAVPALLVVPVPCADCESTGCNGDDPCDTCDGYGERYTYYSAVHDPHNAGSGIVWGSEFDDAQEAARHAHSLADGYAEDAREDDARFQAENHIEDRLESIRQNRREHSRLIRAILQYADGSHDNAYVARDRATLRYAVTKNAERVRELRDNFWSAVS